MAILFLIDIAAKLEQRARSSKREQYNKEMAELRQLSKTQKRNRRMIRLVVLRNDSTIDRGRLLALKKSDMSRRPRLSVAHHLVKELRSFSSVLTKCLDRAEEKLAKSLEFDTTMDGVETPLSFWLRMLQFRGLRDQALDAVQKQSEVESRYDDDFLAVTIACARAGPEWTTDIVPHGIKMIHSKNDRRPHWKIK
jgi:hypothetical protein